MRFLVISDIHSNYAALESVIHHAEPHDARICVGDIVGYGPQPQCCIIAILGVFSLKTCTCLWQSDLLRSSETKVISKESDDVSH